MASARDFERALLQKGFQLERRTTDKLFYLYHDGKRTKVHTKVSEGKGITLGKPLLGAIKRQMYFDSPAQLSQFIDCTIDGPAYIEHLKAKQVIALALRETEGQA